MNRRGKKREGYYYHYYCILFNVRTSKGTWCDKIQSWRIHIALWPSVWINERWPL